MGSKALPTWGLNNVCDVRIPQCKYQETTLHIKQNLFLIVAACLHGNMPYLQSSFTNILNGSKLQAI